MMPSPIHKYAIRDELKGVLPPEVFALMCGHSDSVISGPVGILEDWYRMLGTCAGALDLAYKRGYQKGVEDERRRASGEVNDAAES